MKHIPQKNFIVFTISGLLPAVIFVGIFGFLVVMILGDAVELALKTSEENTLLQFYSDILKVSNLVMISVVLAFIFMVWQYMLTRSWVYEISDEFFRSEYGVLSKKQVTLSFDKVQNVDITRSFIERLFGLATVHIQTSGSSVAEGIVPGLERADAERVRDDILYRSSNA